jgi:acyl-CoA thioesterase I
MEWFMLFFKTLKALNRRHFIASGVAALAAGYAQAQNKSQNKAPNTATNKPTEGKAASILIVGDSLSAEYGLRRGTGWVALLEKRLAEQKIAAKVVNASISGETTSGGRSRLAALLKTHNPTHLVIELGGNDALRGLPVAMTESNLSTMAQAARAAKAQVLLLGMQMPPNYGAAYAAQFAAMYEKVAKGTGAQLVPFFLKGVADHDDPLKLFQADRIHPKEEAQPIMLSNVWPTLLKMLK